MHNTASLRHQPRSLTRYLLVAVLTVMLGGCALPRVGVYKDPLTAEEHLKLGLAYEQKGETDLARREYTEAARDTPHGHLYLANLHFSTGEMREAEAHYRKALAGLPDDPTVCNNLAWLLLQENRSLDEAERLAQRAVERAAPEQRSGFEDTLKRIRAAR